MVAPTTKDVYGKVVDLEKNTCDMDEEDEEEYYSDEYGHDPTVSCSSSSGSGNRGGSINEDTILKHTQDLERTVKRSKFAAMLVLIVGTIASASFLYLGIHNELDTQMLSFRERAVDLVKELRTSLADYELACSWVHEASANWRNSPGGQIARSNFRSVYDYLQAGGIEFYAMEWVPNVTHDERPAVEAEAWAYYEEQRQEQLMNSSSDSSSTTPVVVPDYIGFTELHTEDKTGMVVLPRREDDFYFPVQYFEPMERIGNRTHYDVYTSPWEREAVDSALETNCPVVSEPFDQKDTDSKSKMVVLYHPGVLPANKNDTTHTGRRRRDLSAMLIRIQSLLERSSRSQTANVGVYLYDSTDDDDWKFLGRVHIEVIYNGVDELAVGLDFCHRHVSLADIKAGDDWIHKEHIKFATRTWTAVVAPVDDTYDPNLTFVLLSGSLIFVASLLLALWLLANLRRSKQMNRIVTKAAAEASIVANLFPADVRERMIQDARRQREPLLLNDNDGKSLGTTTTDAPLTSEALFGSKPIAELHPYTSIMCADLVGFTAWSSVREPSQIFTLLEVIYNAFDNTAKRRRVFKVETVGDCYVAVAGLPKPQKDHAKVIARFSTECLEKVLSLSKDLEKTLGPYTGDLGVRIGLHSGQVTAGVLRGDKGRFQLFGDTVNTAHQFQLTGTTNMIHVSPATAQLLREAGHEKWLVPRKEAVKIKNKGDTETYYLSIGGGSANTAESASNVVNKRLSVASQDAETSRLIDWTVEVLSGLLKNIVARRQATVHSRSGPASGGKLSGEGATVLDEVKDIIALPEFNGKAILKQVDPDSIQLDEEVKNQLTALIRRVASMYRDNDFHCFAHASHVLMSVFKMMTRIVNPKEIVAAAKNKKEGTFEEEDLRELHKHTFGIATDPLTQFAAAFSALIHDMDHQGVPNSTLVKEESPLAHKYKNKSVAEQNSVDLAWEFFMGPDYEALRKCICDTEEEFVRFRQLVVNSVMATDIMDKELGAARKARWNKAFSEDNECDDGSKVEKNVQDDINRKATIVIEHLIQASDVSHTFQHWNIYIKWNERLFRELYKAYKTGRIEKDPCEGWYQGEIGFFDFYLIPLAKKLFTCGVFGVSSDEYLNYALINRREWELKGAEIVEQYIKRIKAEEAEERFFY